MALRKYLRSVTLRSMKPHNHAPARLLPLVRQCHHVCNDATDATMRTGKLARDEENCKRESPNLASTECAEVPRPTHNYPGAVGQLALAVHDYEATRAFHSHSISPYRSIPPYTILHIPNSTLLDAHLLPLCVEVLPLPLPLQSYFARGSDACQILALIPVC